MGTLTLAAIALVVLVSLGAAAVLITRRRAGSHGRMPLSLDDPVLPGPPAATGLSEVYTLARQGNKIAAIRRYRELTGAGLKEAKDFVDRL